jgi:hypothetical protein
VNITGLTELTTPNHDYMPRRLRHIHLTPSVCRHASRPKESSILVHVERSSSYRVGGEKAFAEVVHESQRGDDEGGGAGKLGSSGGSWVISWGVFQCLARELGRESCLLEDEEWVQRQDHWIRMGEV